MAFPITPEISDRGANLFPAAQMTFELSVTGSLRGADNFEPEAHVTVLAAPQGMTRGQHDLGTTTSRITKLVEEQL